MHADKPACEVNMHKSMRAIRSAADKSLTFSDHVRLTVKAHFNLGEPQNIVDGEPDLRFSFGAIQFDDNGDAPVSSPANEGTSQILAGGRIQTTMRLSGPSAFTLISVVKQVQIEKADFAA